MRTNKIYHLIPFLFLGIMASYFFACNSNSKPKKKKIFYINSYHKGYPFSDDIMQGATDNLPADSFDISFFYIDSKRISDDLLIYKNIKACLDSIEKFSPDLIIASDDLAVKEIIVPHFKNKEIPVVFCGVNWSCAQYGLPCDNVTGILEVWPMRKTLQTLMDNNKNISKLMVLSENSISEQKNTNLLDSMYKNLKLVVNYELVSNFDEWKEKFNLANKQFDVIFLSSIGGIKNWDETQAKQHIAANLKVPMIAFDDFLMKYAVFGITKINTEQGEWAANAAKKILAGTSPAQIKVGYNKKNQYWLNKEWAQKINLKLDSSVLKQCKNIEISK